MREGAPHPSKVPQRVRAEKGVGPFLPTRVAPISDPRGVAKLVRSTAACGEMGSPQPHQAYAWLLAIFRKLAATWHT